MLSTTSVAFAEQWQKNGNPVKAGQVVNGIESTMQIVCSFDGFDILVVGTDVINNALRNTNWV